MFTRLKEVQVPDGPCKDTWRAPHQEKLTQMNTWVPWTRWGHALSFIFGRKRLKQNSFFFKRLSRFQFTV